MRRLFVMTALLGFAAGLAGCGDGNPGPTTGPKTEPPKEQVQNDDMMVKGLQTNKKK